MDGGRHTCSQLGNLRRPRGCADARSPASLCEGTSDGELGTDRRSSECADRGWFRPLRTQSELAEALPIRREGLGRDGWARLPVRGDLQLPIRAEHDAHEGVAVRSDHVEVDGDWGTGQRHHWRRIEGVRRHAGKRRDLGVLALRRCLDEDRRPRRAVGRSGRDRLRAARRQARRLSLQRHTRALDEDRWASRSPHRRRVHGAGHTAGHW